MSTKLSLSGSVIWDKEIDDLTAAKVIALVTQTSDVSPMGVGVIPPHNESFGPSASLEASRVRFAGRSLIEIFEELDARIKVHQLVVAGFKAMEENDTNHFTTKQVIDQFRSAGISPKNLDREFKKAVGAGLIFKDAGARGKYKTTERALKAFDEGFTNLKIRFTKSKNGLKRGGNLPKLEISDAVKGLQIQPNLDGYPKYHDIKTKGERVLWILIFAAKAGIPKLNSKEIEYLSHELRDQISTSALVALVTSSMRKGYLARSAGEYRLLHEGEQLIGERASEQA